MSNTKGHELGAKSVITALSTNALIGALKFVAFFMTGSGVMLSEGIHSIADTANQFFLFIGIKRGIKPADDEFNYGYRAERFFWSLLSACGIFFLGAGVTIYHGITSLIHEDAVGFSIWTIIILGGSFLLEGFSLLTAYREIKAQSGKEKIIKFIRHSGDPTLLAIIFEDGAALTGILIAATSVILTQLTGASYWDAVGSILVGVLLGVVAVSLMAINRQLLLGRAAPKHIRKKIFTILLHEKVVDEVHDFKTVMLATDGYRVKAEIEVNGEYLANRIFDSREFKREYEEIKSYQDFVKFCSDFSDEVVRTLGTEINCLEEKIEKEVPTVRHIDIETN